MIYWTKVVFFTLLPVIILYFIAWPYYDQSDDAYNTFKHIFFQISVFAVPIALITMNYFFARNRNPYMFLWNVAIILATTILFVEQLGDMYRTSFRWTSPPGFPDSVLLMECTTIIGTALILLGIQMYLVFKSRITSV